MSLESDALSELLSPSCRDVLAIPGDTVTCPVGHFVCDVVGVVRLGPVAHLSDFTNFEQPDLYKLGHEAPPCHCGLDPWRVLSPYSGEVCNRPHTQRGWRDTKTGEWVDGPQYAVRRSETKLAPRAGRRP